MHMTHMTAKIINDPFELLEFVHWLRRSTRDTACVLLSQDAHDNPHVPLDQVRKTVGSRTVTVLLDNAVQRSARNQLGIVNPHHGARLPARRRVVRRFQPRVLCALCAADQPARGVQRAAAASTAHGQGR